MLGASGFFYTTLARGRGFMGGGGFFIWLDVAASESKMLEGFYWGGLIDVLDFGICLVSTWLGRVFAGPVTWRGFF